MKKIIFLLLIPILSFGQLERTQKQFYRGGGSGGFSPSNRTYTPQNNFGTRPSIGEFQQKQIERDRNRQSYYNRPGSNRPIYITDPYWNMWGPTWGWGWNRWYPYTGWNYFDRFWWDDPWGYRNPGRVYIYDNGKRDTVKIKPLHGAFGVSYNKNPEWGVWGTLGREIYIIAEYTKSFQKDNSTYYSDITRDKVIEWKDSRLSDYVKTNLFSIGVGKKITKKFGLHGQIGFGKNVVRQVYFDELYILSNNGQYSIDDYSQNITTVKFGGILDLSKNLSVKTDYDIARKLTFLGVGVRF